MDKNDIDMLFIVNMMLIGCISPVNNVAGGEQVSMERIREEEKKKQ